MTIIAHPRILKQIGYPPTRGRDLCQAFLDQRYREPATLHLKHV